MSVSRPPASPGNDAPLIDERTATRRRGAMECGDERGGAKSGLSVRAPASWTGTPAANDATRDAHARRCPTARRGMAYRMGAHGHGTAGLLRSGETGRAFRIRTPPRSSPQTTRRVPCPWLAPSVNTLFRGGGFIRQNGTEAKRFRSERRHRNFLRSAGCIQIICVR
jgi:hypothetical protein